MIAAFKHKLAASPALTAATGLLVLLVADTLYLICSSYFYPLALPAHYSNKVFLLNLLPIVVVSLIWWLLTARTLVSFILTAVLFDAVFLANKMKMANLGLPSIIVDYVSVFDMVEHSNLLAHYFTSWWHPGILVAFLAAALVLVFIEKPAFNLKPVWRAASMVIVVLLLSQSGATMIRSIYQPGKTWYAWQPVNNLHNFGLLYCLTSDTGQLASRRPDFDDDRLTAILQQPATRMFTPRNDLPEAENIIVILSESFFDPADLIGVEQAQYDLPGYLELQKRSLTGRSVVPAYGGATLRTEFELLTGIALDLFPAHSYPLISLVISPMDSIVWDVRRQGYSTTAIHPNIASFWNRDKAYPQLGFEKFLDLQAFKHSKRSGYYVADAELTNKLKKEIKNDEKQFIFAISMENHGPWKSGRPNLEQVKVDQIETPARLKGEGRMALQQYIYHQQAAEAALLDLIQDLEFRKAERNIRSVVMFFGDHLPALEQSFDELEFKNGQSRYAQSTPYLIYDTHQDLSLRQAATEQLIDITLTGSVLLDISLKNLSEFHLQAERLQQHPKRTQVAMDAGELTDLQELQLWRFWQEPLDQHGHAFEASWMGADKRKQLSERKPLECEIEQWGPKRTYMGEGFNLQPNGQSAFYVKTSCAGRPLDIRIDGQPMWTTREGDVLSTMMEADDLVAESGRHTVELYERTSGRSQPLGVFKVKRRWLPKQE